MNTKVLGNGNWHGRFINLRSDYGSTWEGEILIRNCEYVPGKRSTFDAPLIGGTYSGQHNFGYPCYLPRKITIDGLVIDDSNLPANYPGPSLLSNFNSAYTSETYSEKYPYVISSEIAIRNLTVKSGKPYVISSNPFMFRNLRLKQ